MPKRTLCVGVVFLGLLGCDSGETTTAGAKEHDAPKTETKASGQTKTESPTPSKPPADAPAPKPQPMIEVKIDAGDGTVFADLYPLSDAADRPMIVLYHQAGWNAGEYETIAPRLQALGFHVLATDQRSGGARNDRTNRTVDARGKTTDYLTAYPDLEAALSWARKPADGSSGAARKVIVWGSSYSAALVFKLASEHPQDVAAVLAFSPGEYMGSPGTVAGWAKGVSQPVFVTAAPGAEVTAASAIAAASPSKAKIVHEPSKGVHGSSILIEDRNAGGTAPVWSAVESFLKTI